MGAATDLAKRMLDYLLDGPAVGGADEERLRRWFSVAAADPGLPHVRARYVVVATDADVRDRRARPGALAAIAVDRMRIDYAGCFSAAMRAPAATAPKSAMLDFVEFLQKSPLAAFDAPMEQMRLERAMKSLLGVPLRHPWIDIGALLRVLFRDARCASLDDWIAHFGVALDIGDVALGRALGCAQLALIALDAAARVGSTNARALLEIA